MIDWLKNIDSQILLFINSHHCSFCDYIMFWISDRFIWIPFYFFLTYVLYKKCGSEVWKILLCVGILILLSDQLSVFIKDQVMRYRPCHNLVLQSSVHLVDGKCGGQYGFISSHATNSFALAAFLILLLRKKIGWLVTVLITWCFLIAYSRIYLAQHYPMDVLGGWILGLLLSLIIYYVYRNVFNKKNISMKMRSLCVLILFCLESISIFAQDKSTGSKTRNASAQKPKLVIGIVVDQMRSDYIDRFWNKFGNGGFKRLVNEGFLFSNCHYNYVPTETAPGHASIYTGSTPSVHGIIANLWWNTGAKKNMSSVQEDNNPARLSPNKLLVETVTDRFKKSFADSRVYSISIKDRGAILPGGKNADAAFWFNDTTGKWISSRYYNEEKINAKWVSDFNNINYPKQFLKKGWRLIDEHHYDYSDSSAYEGLLGKKNQPIFPYYFDTTNYFDIKYTSWGNKLTTLFTEQALIHEKLGQTKASDFLCISFSSTDYVGHKFGINSVEIEQIYLDLDSEIAYLLNLFDKRIGKNNYLIFLTADHGAVSNPQYLLDHGQPGGLILFDSLKLKLRNLAGDVNGKDSLLLDYIGDQIKFNDSLIKTRNLNMDSLLNVFTDFLISQPGIALALTANDLKNNQYEYGIKKMMQNGFNSERNGDIMFVLKPNWITWYSKKGTTHGTPYEYDTHVPLIFYGWSITHGTSDLNVKITDIAPTISSLLHIEFPNGCTGKPIKELFK